MPERNESTTPKYLCKVDTKIHNGPHEKQVILDVSGSTSWGGVIERQVEIASQFAGGLVTVDGSPSLSTIKTAKIDMIAFSTTTDVIKAGGPGVRAQFQGTVPSSISNSPIAMQKMKRPSLILFITDGEINQQEITRFTERVPFGNHILIIVIVQEHRPNVEILNVSVVAPMLAHCTNVAVMATSPGEEIKLVHVQGPQMADHLRMHSLVIPEPGCGWNDCSKIDVETVFSNVMFPIHEKKIPQGVFHFTAEDAVEYTFDLKSISTSNKDQVVAFLENEFKIIRLQDWSNMVLQAKLSGRLGEMRMFMRVLYKHAMDIRSAKAKAQQEKEKKENKSELAVLEEHISQRVERVLNRTQFNDDDDLISLRRSMAQYAQVAGRTKKHEPMSDPISVISHIQQLITERESTQYTLSETVSNRVNRSIISMPYCMQERDDCILGDSVSQIECEICCCEGGGAVLFGPGLTEDAVNDYVASYPLANGSTGATSVIAIVVCTTCAYFFEQRNRGPYGGTVSGSVVLTERISDKHWKSIVSLANHVFALGRNVPYTRMMMYSSLRHAVTHMTWTTPSLKTAVFSFLSQMGSRIFTTPSFRDDNTAKVPLPEAIEHLTGSPEYTEFPFEMRALCADELRRLYPSVRDEHVNGLRRISLYAELLATVVRSLKNHEHKQLYVALYLEMFESFYGLALDTPVKPLSYARLLELMRLPTIQSNDTSSSASLNTTHATCFMFTALEQCVLNIALHASMKSGAIVKELRRNADINHFLTTFHYDNTTDAITRRIMSDIQRSIRGDHVRAAKLHEKSIPFYIYNGPYSGPNPLQCACGYSFLPPGTYKLSHATLHVKTRRVKHFQLVYGSDRPDNKSAHCNLHYTCAKIYYADEKKSEQDIVQEVCKNLMDTKRGDVHNPKMPVWVRAAVHSLISLSQTSPNFYVATDDRKCRSLEYKIAAALHLQGVMPSPLHVSMSTLRKLEFIIS